MITVICDCSYHQLKSEPRKFTISFDTINESQMQIDKVTKALEAEGWVVQFNGDYMDTYCSEKCSN